jgi:hypothetical protein
VLAADVTAASLGTAQPTSASQSRFSSESRMCRRNSAAVEPSNARWSYTRLRMPIAWIAMVSPIATGRRLTPSVHRIATFGWLMIGAEA